MDNQHEVVINVVEHCGELCFTSEQGKRLLDCIDEIIDAGKIAIVSFKDVEPCLTAAFLNASFGALLEKRTWQQLKSMVHVQDIDETDCYTLKRVIEFAEKYWHDPQYQAEIAASDKKMFAHCSGSEHQ